MSSTLDPGLCNQKVKELLDAYKKDEIQCLFRDLAEVTRKRCEELLRSKKIKGVVQSRSKAYDSLETKLNGLTKTSEFTKWFAGIDNGGEEQAGLDLPNDFLKMAKKSERSRDDHGGASRGDKPGRDIYEHPDMGDLAGVRVGLFFPGDVLKAAEAIKEIFKVSHTFGTVTDPTRSLADGSKTDIQRHGIGRWISQGPDEDAHHWEHYGYKSWQIVIEWKQPLLDKIASIQADLDALAPPKIFNPLRVEIQVGTVVTQAWAEVQHNIIYKQPADIQATPTMKRMIDATNGLAITTDIILMELERSQAQAEEEAEQRRRWERETPLEMLLSACFDGDHRSVARLLADGVDVNARHGIEKTALHLASQKGHNNVVEQLLADNRVNVDAEDKLGRTAFHLASEEGHSNVVNQLLADNRVDVKARDMFRRTALHMASEKGHSHVVEQLLADGRVDVGATEALGKTALYLAFEEGHTHVVEQLLADDRVDVNARDEFGKTALHFASEEGSSHVVEQLLANDRVDVDARDISKKTALHLASGKDHSHVVGQLLANDRVDVGARDISKKTALHLASEGGHSHVVGQLLADDRVDVDARDMFGKTAHQYASEKGHSKVMEQLNEALGL